MSIDGLVQSGRVLAERTMLDACEVSRSTGESTTGGVITDTWGAPYYTGKCRVVIKNVQGAASDVGEAYRIVRRLVVRLPVVASTADVRVGDRVTVTASVWDASLPGAVYVVREVDRSSTVMYRDLTVLEVTS